MGGIASDSDDSSIESREMNSQLPPELLELKRKLDKMEKEKNKMEKEKDEMKQIVEKLLAQEKKQTKQGPKKSREGTWFRAVDENRENEKAQHAQDVLRM